MKDNRDNMVAAIRALQELFDALGLSAGETAGVLTFYVKYMCSFQDSPQAAEAEFVQKLAEQTLPDFSALKKAYLEEQGTKPNTGDMN